MLQVQLLKCFVFFQFDYYGSYNGLNISFHKPSTLWEPPEKEAWCMSCHNLENFLNSYICIGVHCH